MRSREDPRRFVTTLMASEVLGMLLLSTQLL
ncbi:hypothetical protein EYF80_059187 [Liparis tanakae]|uniref:Uncharacterized protein n=1 Tax=Liparis tanakae TaxID=230148 RepID=A0A4Z2EQV1_9TELE|nr:hypothetical protein EYF80_059187 [Liparis tanakae]